MRNKNLKHDTGKQIGTVTRLPNFILGIQGWLDGRKGVSSVPNARVEAMKNKCVALEKREALIIETRYESERKEGAEAILKLANCKAKDTKETFGNCENSPYAIRAQARAQAKVNQDLAFAEEAKNKLSRVKESLIHADTVLSERIQRTREKALNVKIASYIRGVRKGGIPDYNPDMTLSDDAYSIYISKHEHGDMAIMNAVKEFSKEVA